MTCVQWQADSRFWEIEIRDPDSDSPLLIQRPGRYRANARTIVGKALLRRFLTLRTSAPTSHAKFLRDFGPWPSPPPSAKESGDEDAPRELPVHVLREFAQLTHALIRAASAIRTQGTPIADGDRRALAARLPEHLNPYLKFPADTFANHEDVPIDLTPFLPAEQWRVDPDDPAATIPGEDLRGGRPVFPLAGPLGDRRVTYVPAAIFLKGPSAVGAWLRGDPEWAGRRQAPSPTAPWAQDVLLVGDVYKQYWQPFVPKASFSWNLDASWFEWRNEVLNVRDALALEVTGAILSSRLGTCSACGELFTRSSRGARGRPRLQCDVCYDQTAPNRVSAKKAAKRTKPNRSPPKPRKRS